METETGNDPKRPGVESARIFELTDVHAEEPDRPSHKARVQATLDMVPPGCGSVLEVGCGPGYLLRRVPAVRRFGTDPAVKNLKLVKDPVVVSSITHLPFSDDSVDLVLCAEVLEHLHPRDLEAAARELVRVARKHVLVTVPFQEDLLSGCTRCPSCNRVFHIHGHRTSWDEERLQSLFPSARRIEFKGVWRVRPFSRLRTGVFDLWKHTAFTVCPRCGNPRFSNEEKTLVYRLFNGLNMLAHPVASQWNWLMARIEV